MWSIYSFDICRVSNAFISTAWRRPYTVDAVENALHPPRTSWALDSRQSSAPPASAGGCRRGAVAGAGVGRPPGEPGPGGSRGSPLAQMLSYALCVLSECVRHFFTLGRLRVCRVNTCLLIGGVKRCTHPTHRSACSMTPTRIASESALRVPPQTRKHVLKTQPARGPHE